MVTNAMISFFSKSSTTRIDWVLHSVFVSDQDGVGREI